MNKNDDHSIGRMGYIEGAYVRIAMEGGVLHELRSHYVSQGAAPHDLRRHHNACPVARPSYALTCTPKVHKIAILVLAACVVAIL